MIETTGLPTHLALVARRLKVAGADSSADTWLMASYVAECFLKTIACVLVSGIRKSNPSIAHKLEYELVRADGLGSWEKIIGDCTGHALAGYLDSDLQPLIVWITKRRTQADDEWARDAATRCADILSLLEMPPYVMRVLLGEIASDQRRVPLKSLVPRRSDLLDVVFERSFNKLSEDARWVFLCVSNWRSVIPELALVVTLGLRGLDAERGMEECLRLSLLSRYELADESMSLSAPELARHFGRKKLEGDPDRLLIKEDLELIQSFGPLHVDQVGRTTIDSLIDKLHQKAMEAAERGDSSAIARFDSILVHTAELHPAAWLRVAEFRQTTKATAEQIDEALRRAVEEMPYSRDAWLARARHAQANGSDATMIAALVSAVDADPSDVELIREVAFELCRYIDAHKFEIPIARRGVYVASVRSHMEALADDLDATGLSRLAWLFLLEDDKDGAWKYANMGLAKDSVNRHCTKVVERLDEQGYIPPTMAGP